MAASYPEEFIKFLGTAGSRFVVSKQLRASGGLWVRLAGQSLSVDPGPGALVKAYSSRPKLDLVRSAIVFMAAFRACAAALCGRDEKWVTRWASPGAV